MEAQIEELAEQAEQGLTRRIADKVPDADEVRDFAVFADEGRDLSFTEGLRLSLVTR
jgi:hypothetical protein